MSYNLQNREGVWAIALRSLIQIVRRPVYWFGFLFLPLFMFLFLTSMFESGLPTRVPAAMVDRDGSAMSRELTQQLEGMQMVNFTETANSFSEARKLMQEGKIYGFFLIPENFQADVLSGREPVLTFYTNMSYFVPGTMLFKSFKTTATYTKAGLILNVANSLGADGAELSSMMMPVQIQARGLGNPWLNYGIYLGNSFVPCALELMIFLMTCFTLCQEIKYHTSPQLMRMAGGSIVKAVFGKLLPQTFLWSVMSVFMLSWLYRYNDYPMHGSWLWMIISEIMFVLACQGFALLWVCVFTNLRMSLSVSALIGILAFSIAAFSFPVESMYGGVAIFSYIVPVRFNFLIYIDQALNGIDIAYSKYYFIGYIIFIVLPFTMLWKLKKAYLKPVYAP